MRIKWIAAALVAAMALAGCGGAAKKGPTDTTSPGASYQGTKPPGQTQQPPVQQPQGGQPAPPPATSKKQWSAPPAMQIDPTKQYTATIKTSMGDIKVELFAKDAPKTVNNFVFLAREKFYDGVTFHRIIKDFMVQTGDPKGNGSGGPGYRFNDELPAKRSYEPGILAMANSGANSNTNGSQFFICNGANSAQILDPQPYYTQFGKVVAGMDVLQKLSSVPVAKDPASQDPMPSKPVNPPTIQTVIIEEK